MTEKKAPAKKAAAKKAAAKPAAKDDETTVTAAAPVEDPPPAPVTADDAPADDAPTDDVDAGATPARKKSASLASPLDPPKSSEKLPVQPSTSRVAASAAAFSIAGDNHKRLIDEDGNTLGPDDLFDEGNGPESWVTTKQRIYEEFTQTNSVRKTTRLLYPAGARVGRDRAEAVKQAAALGPEFPDDDE